ncbi:PqqD family protein [Nonomuraea sp. NPDC049421]|uniref:PqqD family protein n=1 Tax=Nonomuraea sp. NPDC049421 TaxID=3155275 RepID=UPI003414190B
MSLRISDAVVWQETGEGISLYHTETGDFRTLNETGSKIWLAVAGGGEAQPVASTLSREFAGTDPALIKRIVADVHAFIGTMVDQGMFEESPA